MDYAPGKTDLQVELTISINTSKWKKCLKGGDFGSQKEGKRKRPTTTNRKGIRKK